MDSTACWWRTRRDRNGGSSTTAPPRRKRIRFTVAHELGHYLLHSHRQDRFECGAGDIETGDHNDRDIEAEADRFASTLLMPLDDFRRQVDGQRFDFVLLGHCAERYGVSLTAAALRWVEIALKRAVLIASRDDRRQANTQAHAEGRPESGFDLAFRRPKSVHPDTVNPSTESR